MAPAAIAPVAPAQPGGLTEAEAGRRLAERGRERPPASSRSYASIVRANVFTIFNLILAVAGGLTLAYGEWRDALFLGILVANTTIGIVQELRAKLALDRLAALVAPVATVVRDGQPRQLGVGEVVVGDLVRLAPGDQVVADGVLGSGDGLMLDESILTGESRAVSRAPGDEARSGSFVAEGAGAYTVTAVGAESYAERIASVARSFRHPRSPLERSLNRLLLALVAAMVPLGMILGFSLWRRDAPSGEAVSTAVAGIVTLVPEGLILLASLTYAVAALKMARRGALAQQLNAIESLASVDVICLDKTGTLTEAALDVAELVPAAGVEADRLAAALGRYAAAAPARNLTLEAIAEAHPAAAELPAAQVPFTSRRRWSALALSGVTYVLGAPELFPLGPLADRARDEARAGRRVVCLGTTGADLDVLDPDAGPPQRLEPLGLVVIAERLRAEARDVVEYFRREGVELKVLSGDRPETVAAVAADAGIPSSAPPLDGRELPTDAEQLGRLARETAVIGRIAPEGKQRVVEALRDQGQYVAMVGDGVNDVPALKAARLAIAQGTGAQMAKSVADVVLVSGDFAAVPPMVHEGRKILRNIQRVAKLFVSKSVFAAFLILVIGTTPTSYPFLPRHLSLASTITIGIPAFFLALAASSGPWRTPGFLREVARFSLPAGTAAGLGVCTGYLFALNVLELSLREARTVATIALVLIGFYLILVLDATSRRRAVYVGTLCAVLAAAFLTVLLLPSTRDFFALAVPGPVILATALGGAVLATGGLWLLGFAPPFAAGGPPPDGEVSTEAPP